MKILKKLLGICEHEWEFYKGFNLTYGGEKYGEKLVWTCKKCLKVKEKTIE